jgi:transcriptional regulator with XRE-family HTH domain
VLSPGTVCLHGVRIDATIITWHAVRVKRSFRMGFMKLAKYVKELRLRLGESQQKFATDLGISIRGLVNYEKDRDPPFALLMRLSAKAHDAGHRDIEKVFSDSFHSQIEAALEGRPFSLMREADGDKPDSGLIIVTFDKDQDIYGWAYYLAMSGMKGAQDAHTRQRMKRALHQMYKTVFSEAPNLPGKKRTKKSASTEKAE